MAPRLQACPKCHSNFGKTPPGLFRSRYATTHAISLTPKAVSTEHSQALLRYPSAQPPSHKPPEFRRSQLHRQYTSMLKSTPLMVLFQHNNLTASEWAGIRRELQFALERTDKLQDVRESSLKLSSHVKLQVIKTGVFAAALRVAEYYMPADPTSQSLGKFAREPFITHHESSLTTEELSLSHSLSRTAYKAVFNKRYSHPLVPLLNGPIAVLTFPYMSTEHLKAALSILTPSQPNFPAPTRRSNPGYYEPPVQSGLSKLILLGARVEGSVFDVDKTRWVGTIAGGIDGLRAQLVATLQGSGVAITTNLEAASKNLYLTLEAHHYTLKEGSEPMADLARDKTES